jgi:hypothetical protein
VALMAVAITLSLAYAQPVDRLPPRAVFDRTAIVLLSFYIAMAYVLRVLARVTEKLLLPLAGWVAATWVLPLTVDYVLWWTAGAPGNESMLGVASGFSPVGALVEIWTGRAAVTTPGLVFQCLFAATVVAAYYVTAPKWTRRAPAK